MNTQEAITLIQLRQGATIISARYLDDRVTNTPAGIISTDRTYHFKARASLVLWKNDIVIVQTKDTYALVKIVDVNISPADCGCPLEILKHVVDKLDLSEFDRVLKSERDATHRLAMSEVTQKLQAYRDSAGASALDDAMNLLAPPREVKRTTDMGSFRDQFEPGVSPMTDAEIKEVIDRRFKEQQSFARGDPFYRDKDNKDFE